MVSKRKVSDKTQGWINTQFFWDTGSTGQPRLNTFVSGQAVPTNPMAAVSYARSWCTEHKQRESDPGLKEAINCAPHIVAKVNAPGEPRLFQKGHVSLLNTWSPHVISNCEPKSEAPKSFDEFMRNLFPLEAERQYMMEWLAVVCMRPQVRLRTSVILRSIDEGVGKDVLIAKLIGKCMLGQKHFVGMSLRAAKSDFNGPLAGKRLVHVEEVYSKDSTANANKLKAMVTNDDLLVNQKYEQQYTTAFFGAFVISSNDKRPLILPAEDRRWFIPQIISKTFTDKEVSAKFFGALIDSFESGGAAQELGGYFEFICRDLEEKRSGDLEGHFSVAMNTEAKADLIYVDTKFEAEDRLRLQLGKQTSEMCYQIDECLTSGPVGQI